MSDRIHREIEELKKRYKEEFKKRQAFLKELQWQQKRQRIQQALNEMMRWVTQDDEQHWFSLQSPQQPQQQSRTFDKPITKTLADVEVHPLEYKEQEESQEPPKKTLG